MKGLYISVQCTTFEQYFPNLFYKNKLDVFVYHLKNTSNNVTLSNEDNQKTYWDSTSGTPCISFAYRYTPYRLFVHACAYV